MARGYAAGDSRDRGGDVDSGERWVSCRLAVKCREPLACSSGQGATPMRRRADQDLPPEGLRGQLLTQTACPAGQVMRHYLDRQPGRIAKRSPTALVQPDVVLEVSYGVSRHSAWRRWPHENPVVSSSWFVRFQRQSWLYRRSGRAQGTGRRSPAGQSGTAFGLQLGPGGGVGGLSRHRRRRPSSKDSASRHLRVSPHQPTRHSAGAAATDGDGRSVTSISGLGADSRAERRAAVHPSNVNVVWTHRSAPAPPSRHRAVLARPSAAGTSAPRRCRRQWPAAGDSRGRRYSRGGALRLYRIVHRSRPYGESPETGRSGPGPGQQLDGRC